MLANYRGMRHMCWVNNTFPAQDSITAWIEHLPLILITSRITKTTIKENTFFCSENSWPIICLCYFFTITPRLTFYPVDSIVSHVPRCTDVYEALTYFSLVVYKQVIWRCAAMLTAACWHPCRHHCIITKSVIFLHNWAVSTRSWRFLQTNSGIFSPSFNGADSW